MSDKIKFDENSCIEEIIRTFNSFREEKKNPPSYIVYGLGNEEVCSYVRFGKIGITSLINILELMINDFAKNTNSSSHAECFKELFNILTKAFGEDKGVMH